MECHRDLDHPAGMLDRDQRTAKMCLTSSDYYKDRRSQRELDTASGACQGCSCSPPRTTVRQVLRRTTQYSASLSKSKKHHSCTSLQRLKQALIVGTYLSLVAFCPSVRSAPTNLHSHNMLSDPPKWVNPCGVGVNTEAVHLPEAQAISDAELLSQIVYQTNIALRRAERFKEKFVQDTFNTNWDDYYSRFKDTDYDWLPTKSLAKKLGESISPEHLNTLELDATLVLTYNQLQKIAVGLEQVVADQTGAFKSDFETVERNLVSVLCEMQMAIVERNLEMLPDATRDVMGQEIRDAKALGQTHSNLRNWVIYRDYMNMLEYVKEVFEFFISKLPASSN